MAYERLQQEEPLLNDPTHKTVEGNDKANTFSGSRGVSLIVCFIACLCTLTNVGLLVLWERRSVPTKSTALSSDYGVLEVANSYIKLDTAVYDIPRISPRPIINLPITISRISAQEPRRVYTDDSSWMSKLGLVYPEESLVRIANQESTIFQFRTLDFGMERCSVVLSLPQAVHDPHHSHRVTAPSYTPGSKINLWQLRAPSRLDATKISWSSRPSREKEVFAGFTVGINSTELESHEFQCASGAIYTFEASCANHDTHCALEFLQDAKQHGKYAFYLKQQAST